ncbi:hypothetical protein QYE76_031680 [Lolium multiflorum]|uniref:CCHC-type domain-containing protein n=1 Tax=Lolium multiflorum TaxID=4521 RepID=A0AAD8QUF5_LOLMU|nr:hypothetical protein QYE76_031680 [Lolium multiflorum]
MKMRRVIMVTLKKNPLLESVVLVVAWDMAPVVVVLSPSEQPALFLHNRKTMGWMEMLMHRGRGRESLEMTMHRFIHGLKYNIKGIVRHHRYNTMNELLHHAREAESQLAEEAQITGHATGAGRFTSRVSSSTAPVPSLCPASFPTSSSKPVSNVSNTKKSEPAASGSGSSMSTARNRDMACHTCGGKDHFKRDCPNRKVMIINEDDEYETGDGADPNAPEDDEMLILLKLALLLCHNWLSDNGEMKVNHMVRVDFEIGPYKDSIDFDVVPMTVCHLLLGRPWLYDHPIAPEHLQDLSNDTSERGDSSAPIGSHTEENAIPKDERDDPLNPEAVFINPQSSANDISD